MQKWLNMSGGDFHPTTFYMDLSLFFVHHYSQSASTSCELARPKKKK